MDDHSKQGGREELAGRVGNAAPGGSTCLETPRASHSVSGMKNNGQNGASNTYSNF